MNIIEKSSAFLKETKLETKKVNWPTRQETIKYTLVVVLVSLVIAAFLGGLDYIYQLLLNYFVL